VKLGKRIENIEIPFLIENDVRLKNNEFKPGDSNSSVSDIGWRE
jgi:hypothetical protein